MVDEQSDVGLMKLQELSVSVLPARMEVIGLRIEGGLGVPTVSTGYPLADCVPVLEGMEGRYFDDIVASQDRGLNPMRGQEEVGRVGLPLRRARGVAGG